MGNYIQLQEGIERLIKGGALNHFVKKVRLEGESETRRIDETQETRVGHVEERQGRDKHQYYGQRDDRYEGRHNYRYHDRCNDRWDTYRQISRSSEQRIEPRAEINMIAGGDRDGHNRSMREKRKRECYSANIFPREEKFWVTFNEGDAKPGSYPNVDVLVVKAL